jgi:catechol 2,3-dioxygenase
MTRDCAFVIEGIYLNDPDGNGVELYWDRPRNAWPRTPQGTLAMYTRPLDLQNLLAEAEPEESRTSST